MGAEGTMLQNYFGKSTEYFTIIGILVTAYAAFKVTSSVLNGVVTYFLSRMLGLSLNLKNAGSWAVVTGSTDGIGKAYAEQLAEQGLNIVLISRTRSKLEEVAKDIESRFKVQTRIIAVDFTRSDIYDSISKELVGLDVGTLVNNVGMSTPHPEFFDQIQDRDQFIVNTINCNAVSVAMMTSIVLPGMVAKKKGVIINISSAAGRHPLPLLALYSATKSFMDFFSRSLQQEYASKGITVQVVMPSFVTTKMSTFKRASLFVPTPTSYVRSALGTLGLQSRTVGCWPHAVQDFFFSKFVPDALAMNFNMKLRARILQRKRSSKED